MGLIPKLWNDATCFILGGGPSLVKIDVSRLQDKRVIAVNAAYRLAPWADVCWFGDGRFHDWNMVELMGFKGLKFTCADRQKWSPGIIQIQRSGRKMFGIDISDKCVAWNRSSGASAINLAVNLGAKRIVLLGYDMKLVDGKHNWHNYHQAVAPKDVYVNRFLEAFPHIKRALDDLGIECYNVSEDSALTDFPFITIDEALSW
jgi:hypothetical protein